VRTRNVSATPAIEKGLLKRFTDPMVKKSIEADLRMLEAYDELLKDLEDEIERQARHHDKKTLELLRSIPGVGKILALLMLYEIDDISRFPTVGQFISYSRLVKCAHESAGKRSSGGHDKIGNPHLKWAFSEAAVLLLKGNDRAKRLLEKLTKRHGKAKALSILAQKLGRTVYYMLKRGEAFDAEKFFGDGMGEPGA
jgi:transposase